MEKLMHGVKKIFIRFPKEFFKKKLKFPLGRERA